MMNDVIEALKSYMNYTGLSQRNVAEILGVSEATVSRYLSYERRPNSAIYDKMANLLGIKTIAENDIHTIKNIIERLIKALQSASVFLGKAIQETKVSTGKITDDIEELESEIEDIVADIPDDPAPADDTTPDEDNPDNNEET
jgi:predicted transcriptional regulator